MKALLLSASLFLIAGGAVAEGTRHTEGITPEALTWKEHSMLQQAVDTYLRERGAAEYISGVGLHVSRSADAPGVTVTAGRTSFGEAGGPIRPNTLFQVGSITKSFTAVLLLKLEAAGVLDIHDTLGTWLPQYPDWASVTIEQLLNMTAPIPDYMEVPAFQREFAADIRRQWRPRELVEFVYPGTELPRPPPWFYSNTNYALAQMIVTRATVLSYTEALRTMLFEPLGLRQTYYRPRMPPRRVLEVMANGYFFAFGCPAYDSQCGTPPLAPLRGEDVKEANLSAYGAAGGIVASLPDVVRWVRALFGDTLLPPRQKAELFSLVSTTNARPITVVTEADRVGYSLGILQSWQPALAGPLWSYLGGTLGFRVEWFRRPGDDLVVTIALNSAVDTPSDKIDTLYETVLRILEPGAVVDPAAASNITSGP